MTFWDFPGGPVVKIPHFHCRGHRFGSIPGQGIKIPHLISGGTAKKKKKDFHQESWAWSLSPGTLTLSAYRYAGQPYSVWKGTTQTGDCQGVGLFGETQSLKLLTVARHQSNHLHELSYCQRS